MAQTITLYGPDAKQETLAVSEMSDYLQREGWSTVPGGYAQGAGNPGGSAQVLFDTDGVPYVTQ